MAVILDGKALSAQILNEIKQKVSALDKKPSLAVIIAGDNKASEIYVKNKEKKALEIGFNSKVIKLPQNVSATELKAVINDLNNDDNIHAVLLQLPLPKHLNAAEFLELIDPKKDVDGFHPINTGKLLTNSNPYAVSCTPKGIITLLKKYNIELSGKNALVIGRSNIVGKPLSLLLLNENATVTMAHSKTKDLPKIAKSADIIIAASGVCALVTKDFVKEGAIVVDVGITRDETGKIKGDVAFDEVSKIASYITPVPGGVGPMTIAMLMQNTLELYLNAQL